MKCCHKTSGEPGYFRFSGYWLLVFNKDSDHLYLYDTDRGVKIATFHKTTTDEFRSSSDWGFSITEGEGGFYVYKNERPFLWFGRTRLRLDSGKGNFC